MDGWIYGLDGWMDRWMDGWMDGRTDEWKYERMGNYEGEGSLDR